jgi:hypothetical protein
MKRLTAAPGAMLLAATLAGTVITSAAAQDARIARIQAEPAQLVMKRGGEATLILRALDGSGNAVATPLRVGGARNALAVEATADGQWAVRGLTVGTHEIIVSTQPESGGTPLTLRVPVNVEWPAIARLEVQPAGGARLYEGTRLPHLARIILEDGTERPYAPIAWQSSDPAVATVDRFGNVRATGTGTVEISAEVDGERGIIEHDVQPLRIARLEIEGGRDEVRTGDVQTFRVVARTAEGTAIDDVPVTWSHLHVADDSIRAPQAPGQLENGRFVASVPGIHTVIATAGPHHAESSFRVTRRDMIRKVQVVGQGREARVFTTDFWVFEGTDGRDYAFTGSKMGDGITFVWDVTDPTAIVKTDSIQVDARTVNDVKVSPDGRWAALSREGASNRRNGVVLLDLADPAHPVIASVYDDGLTGGVHNMFATDDHLFALSNGDKYVIIDVTDLAAPRFVSEYDHPDSRVHDVWVHDGIAYSAEWGTGVVVVDVGNGRWGGSIENPKFVTSFPLPTGSTHAVFPYHQQSTGRFLLFVGDERVQRNGLAWRARDRTIASSTTPRPASAGIRAQPPATSRSSTSPTRRIPR